jgi:tetratricopeptide (TPR) repeat protein
MKGMAMSEKTTSEISLKDSPSESMSQGQIPCLLVYPDRKHVEYVNQIVSCLEELLPSLGFSINKLCDQTPPDKHFGENFEKLAEDCILGIVILDGFRPNVLFEYGFLRGKEKVILPLQDKKACIAVRSFYPIRDIQDGADVKANTGLTRFQFDRLKQPEIGYFNQLSDRHGINVVCIDRDAELGSPEHPKQKIKASITKLMPEILAKFANQSLQPIKQESSQYFKKLRKVALRILQYYTHTILFDQKQLEEAFNDMQRLEKDSGLTMPSSAYSTLAASFESLAVRTPTVAPTDATKLLSKAVELNERALKIETNLSERVDLYFRIGDAYWSLSNVRDTELNLKKAIKAYEEALTIQTKKDFPTKYAMIKHNLGNVYNSLSDVRHPELNLKKAIKIYQEVIGICTKKNFPTQYAMTQNNLGAAYSSLSNVRDTELNLKKAIKAYEEALTIQTKKDFPTKYAMIKHNLGDAYNRLSDVRHPELNLKKAIKAYEEALTIRTKKDSPIDYAMTQSNLGVAYAGLSKVRDKELNLKKAIKAHEEALTIQTKKDFPTQYTIIQNNLGNAYTGLSKVRDRELNLKKAIKAYEEALTIRTKEDFPTYYADTQSNLGDAYAGLSEIRDFELNVEKAIRAYEEALTIHTKKDSPISYATIQDNLGDAYWSLSNVRDTELNLKKAIKAYEEALTIQTKKDFPIKHAATKAKLRQTQQSLKVGSEAKSSGA